MTSTHIGEPGTRASVLLFDPITWVDDWSYEVEAEGLAKLGVELVIPPDRATRDELLAKSHIVVVSSVDDLTASHIDKLEVGVGILCYSAGMDAVDLDAAARAGIPVRNIRSGTVDVADHAMTLLLAAWRRLPAMTGAAAAGEWDLSLHPEWKAIPRIEGRRLGIFGPGAIGSALASRARAFGLTTVATYRRPDQAEADLPHVPLDELFATCDAVVLTASLNPSTAGVIDKEVLTKAKGIVLVNVGRGGLIVESDLAAALDAGNVSFAALDVRHPEPPEPSIDVLSGRPDVMTTPHMAGVTADALESLHYIAVDEITSLLTDAGLI